MKWKTIRCGSWMLWALLAPACSNDSSQGLRLTPWGGGPLVQFELESDASLLIPLPNNLATRPDPSSPTHRRLSLKLKNPSQWVARQQEMLDQLDGFGIFAPISVSFDKPLDLGNLVDRHQRNLDLSDDAVFLIDIDSNSPSYGQPVLLDVGRGNFPILLRTSNDYFLADPRGQAGNLLFDTYEEDLDHNGILDPGEDTDDDGVLDHPNLWPPESPLKDSLLTYYESETNTLLLRPVVPLRERTTYAVVLTDRLTGKDRQPVRSPFAYIHHLDQSEELSRIPDVLQTWNNRYGIDLSLDQVAFAWTFTTQTVTGDLVAIREGLYGIGPFSWLQNKFPATVTPDQGKDLQQAPPFYLVETSRLLPALRFLYTMLFGNAMGDIEPLLKTFEDVDYFVSGSFVSPAFLGETDEVFQMDASQGSARAGSARITFTMSIPKETDRFHPPFPVVIYSHGYSTSRLEFLGFAGTMARDGLATVAIDAWGHGTWVNQETKDLAVSAGSAWGIEPFFKRALLDRARDLTGDGIPDSGGDFFTVSAFHTRDAIRQTVIDHLQLVRALRQFDGGTRWPLDQDGDGREDVAGDFNLDGQIDAGGPGVNYYSWGQSGGAIHSSILGPIEPAVAATAPAAVGAGLSDVGLRTDLEMLHGSLALPLLGPLVVGVPDMQKRVQVSLQVPLSNQGAVLDIAEVEALNGGEVVVVANLSSGEERSARVKPNLAFRVPFAASENDLFTVSIRDLAGAEITRLDSWSQDVWYVGSPQRQEPTYRAGEPLRTPASGYGLARCTPGLRRQAAWFQQIAEPADPVAYASHYFIEPLPIRPEGATQTNLLEIISVGDPFIPVNTQTAMGRAAGVIPFQTIDPRYGMTVNDWLIDQHVFEGIPGIGRFPGRDFLFDPDNLDQGSDGYRAPEPTPGQELRMKIQTQSGTSGVRFMYLYPLGWHGIYVPDPSKPFDVDSYTVRLISRYFASGGKDILDDLCLENGSCAPL